MSKEIRLDLNNNHAPTCLECRKVVEINSFMARQLVNLRQVEAITPTIQITTNEPDEPNEQDYVLSELAPEHNAIPDEVLEKQRQLKERKEQEEQNVKRNSVIRSLNKL